MTTGEARAAMMERFLEEWKAHAVSEDVPVLWDNVHGQPPTTKDANGQPKPFVRVSIRHSTGGQETHAVTGAGPRYQQLGIVTVQVFTASGLGFRHTSHDKLVKVALRAFSKRAGAVWFRQQRPNEIGPDAKAPYFQTNVVSEFVYSQRRAA